MDYATPGRSIGDPITICSKFNVGDLVYLRCNVGELVFGKVEHTPANNDSLCNGQFLVRIADNCKATDHRGDLQAGRRFLGEDRFWEVMQ